MGFESTVLIIGTAIDAIGVALILFGVLLATGIFLRELRRGGAFPVAYSSYRQGLGRAILLGLEFLVAGDIIRTVAISPTFESVGVLALIVAVRTLLSFSLQVEVQGRWPWQSPKERRPQS
ncbi:DUF1622 domain-containing protein [Natronosporangium hydrolyticum]|uniref:DUF1622 domain-containing protein n=1 Tax=Natronosporangium hydrolyticum TaxID=2811111 RepID=A0A895YLE5_9ACTN|nr:DUF1622 domain-containing protein [Natronosporangium hydrolyticum]QSB16802.1 DUF1622 domain-containing protein [Natronosporangium hydrolyticum]